LYLTHALREMPARGVARHFEEPGPKQSMIAHLSGLLVNREHHFLGQIFSHGSRPAAPRSRGNLIPPQISLSTRSQ
jgi:hypothetical protein